MIRIGIDVGGTNTDAVLMDGARVIATHKSVTTADIGTGIATAMAAVMEASEIPAAEVSAVMIGTTQFTNAVVERKRLMPTAAVRVAAPATLAVPPFTGWPSELAAALGEHAYIVRGGNNYDGTHVDEIDEAEIRAVAADLRHKDIRTAAVNATFSTIDSSMETRVEAILLEELPHLSITRGSDIGQLGLLERENASLINASLRYIAQMIMRSFELALIDAGIDAPLYISQNDGTLMNAATAERYPVLTFASGPTNSMRGAAFLSGHANAIVVDIGGTTTDVGALRGGFPREAPSEAEVGSVKTNFRMPDVFSFGIGGGSIVRLEEDDVTIGPDSVGFELTTKAKIFGGDVLTLTDVAVAAGAADIGDSAKVADLPTDLVERVMDLVHEEVEAAIDRTKLEPGDVPVLLVGGGTILISRPLLGADPVVRPDHAPVANAIGAAIAQASGEADKVLSLDELSREDALEMCRKEAREKAILAGADPERVEIAEQDEIPLSYIVGANVSRFKVRAVGDLLWDAPVAVRAGGNGGS